jgi:hypothetical protein
MRLHKASLEVVPLGEWNRPLEVFEEGLCQAASCTTFRISFCAAIRIYIRLRNHEASQGQPWGGSTWGLE